VVLKEKVENGRNGENERGKVADAKNQNGKL
jgi:hypothetical protein